MTTGRLLVPNIGTMARTDATPILGEIVYDTGLDAHYFGAEGPNNTVIWEVLNVAQITIFDAGTVYEVNQAVRETVTGDALFLRTDTVRGTTPALDVPGAWVRVGPTGANLSRVHWYSNEVDARDAVLAQDDVAYVAIHNAWYRRTADQVVDFDARFNQVTFPMPACYCRHSWNSHTEHWNYT